MSGNERRASTWQAQLQKHLAEQPVLAVVSGLGGSNWAPVHAFCEQAAVPCLFPNVEVPAEEGKGSIRSTFPMASPLRRS
jgi:hypothetical protein